MQTNTNYINFDPNCFDPSAEKDMKRIIDFDLFDDNGIFTVRIEFIQQTDDPMQEAIELIKAHEKYKDNVHYWWWVK